jgi:hypothetical protein
MSHGWTGKKRRQQDGREQSGWVEGRAAAAAAAFAYIISHGPLKAGAINPIPFVCKISRKSHVPTNDLLMMMGDGHKTSLFSVYWLLVV